MVYSALDVIQAGPSLYALPPVGVGIATAVLGIAVLIRERASRASLSYALLSLVVTAWLTSYFGIYSAPNATTAIGWIKAENVAICFLPSVVFLFTLSIVQRLDAFKVWVWVAFGVSALLAFGNVTTDLLVAGTYQYPWGFYAKYGPLGVPLIGFFYLLMLGSLGLYWNAYNTTRDVIYRKRFKAFLVAFAVSYIASIDYLPAYGINVYPFGYLPVFAFLLVAARTISRYQLVDLTPAFAASQILETMQGATLLIDSDGHIRLANRAACEMLEQAESKLIGQPIQTIVNASGPVNLSLSAIVSQQHLRNQEMKWQTHTGRSFDVSVSASILRDREGNPAAFVCVATDISELKQAEEQERQLAITTATAEEKKKQVVELNREIEERKRVEKTLKKLTQQLETSNARLEDLVMRDPLTELLNRRGLQQALSKEINLKRPTQAGLVAILLSLDDFKKINNELGHMAGDITLKEIGKKLSTFAAEGNCIARVGGDAFMILLPNTKLPEGKQIAEKIRLGISSTPVSVASRGPIHVTASVGVVEVTEQVASVDELLSQTHPALLKSKQLGKNRVSERNGENGNNGHHLEEALDTLRKGQGFLAYVQPIMRLSDEQAVGYEFLSRSSIETFRNPDDFFRISQEANMLTWVDHLCLKTCVDASHKMPEQARWHLNLFPSTMIGIPVQHILDEFPEGVTRGSFCVEISEQQIIGNPSYLAEPVAALRQAGILIAIDDVGFGQSCLESLVLLNPDIIKIDKKLVFNVSQDSDRANSLRRLLRVAESLHAEVVAEGIERREDLEFLKDVGVHYGQGYLWGRPQEAALAQ